MMGILSSLPMLGSIFFIAKRANRYDPKKEECAMIHTCKLDVKQDIIGKIQQHYLEGPDFDLTEEEAKDRAQNALDLYSAIREKADIHDHLSDQVYMKARYDRKAGLLDPTQIPEERPPLDYYISWHSARQAMSLYEEHLKQHTRRKPPSPHDRVEV